MEGVFFEAPILEFAAAFTGLLLLLAALAVTLLAGMAEEEKAGARLLWAEWPLPEFIGYIPYEETRTRLAA